MIPTARSEIGSARPALSLICGLVDFRNALLFLLFSLSTHFPPSTRFFSCFESRYRGYRVLPNVHTGPRLAVDDAPGYIPASASNLPIGHEARQVAVSLCRLNCFEEAPLLFIHRETTLLEINETIRGPSPYLWSRAARTSDNSRRWCSRCTSLKAGIVARVVYMWFPFLFRFPA